MLLRRRCGESSLPFVDRIRWQFDNCVRNITLANARDHMSYESREICNNWLGRFCGIIGRICGRWGQAGRA